MDLQTSRKRDRVREIRDEDADYSAAVPVRTLPRGLRPREEMDRIGVREVPDDVLLAVIVQSGIPGRNVAEVARDLLRRFGTFTGMARASVEELCEVDGIGPVRARVLAAALEMARRIAREGTPDRVSVRKPEDAASLLREDARALDREVFWVLCLDSKNHVKGNPDRISQGLLDSSQVHPREVFCAAIQRRAAGVILVHNHPSGDPTPSAEDIRITRQIVQAGRVVDIKVLDHVVLGKTTAQRPRDFVSLREEGVVEFES